MSWFSSLFASLFPSRYSREELNTIPHSPEPEHQNIFSLYDYHSKKGKELIYYIKRKEDRVLSQYVAENMCETLNEYLAEQQQFSFFLNPIVIAIPLTRKQQKVRGFNQSARTARYLAKNIQAEYKSKLLYKNRETQKQALLQKRSDRFINVQNCFSIKSKSINDFYQRDIIVVDDLITTGATLSSLEKTLRTAGARNVISITIAH